MFGVLKLAVISAALAAAAVIALEPSAAPVSAGRDKGGRLVVEFEPVASQAAPTARAGSHVRVIAVDDPTAAYQPVRSALQPDPA